MAVSARLRPLSAVLFACACTARATPPAPLAPLSPREGGNARGASALAPSKPPHAPPPAKSQLDLVRPPSAPCFPDARDASAPALVDRAADFFDAGRFDRALQCAEEALSDAPRSVPALHYRAAALVALGRTEEAKLAYARALAVDPDDPETLHGAADLYVSRLGGDRELLELGEEYALRGAREALRARKVDHDLAGGLYLLAGMAENDLGLSKDALSHLDLALAQRPDDVDARYERGVALYELCRFPEAKKSFEQVLKAAPGDPWATHYLALAEERLGHAGRAQKLMSTAIALDPDDFKPAVAIDAKAFDAEVQSAIAALPEREKKALRGVPVEVEDLPAVDDLTAVDPPLSPSILGLFRGPSEGEPCEAADGPHCRSIVFYRKNLARFARDPKELDEQVRVTLLHELGHLHGENDDELRERGLE